MTTFDIVAHRGAADGAPENTIQAFERAIELGADAVELDVRLTKDLVPVVYHYFYLNELTSLTGPIFGHTLGQLRQARFKGWSAQGENRFEIPALQEVIEVIDGRVRMEIEIKGPEPEAPKIVGRLLCEYRSLLATFEVTSFEPQLLVSVQEECAGIAADLLYPQSEPWMGLDVVAYTAINKARTARAQAVHLHPTQLSEVVVNDVRQAGFEVHAWDVNDEDSLGLALKCQIPVICTDRVKEAIAYRTRIGG